MTMKKIGVNKLKYSNAWVLPEAGRCLNCFEPPCQQHCPAQIPIPKFIRAVNNGNIKYAAEIIYRANPLSSICGMVCPEEVFCQSACTRTQIDSPIRIRELHEYATANATTTIEHKRTLTGTVAVIGSGPAGLACAAKLTEQGINVTIYESADHPGGVPSKSIPDFRISDNAINSDIDRITKQGVDIRLSEFIEKPAELLDKYDAVFIAAGLSLTKKTNIPGSESKQILDALSFLENARAGNPTKLKSKSIVIIGGGNVSLDVAATAIEVGAVEVHLLYRRGPNEMLVWSSELIEAQARGVVIDFLVAPIEYLVESQQLKAIKCSRTRLSDNTDSSGRRIPETIPGTEFIIPCDYAIEAVGIKSDYCNEITVNDDYTTSVEGIFAGGDWAHGEGTIVEAVRDGKAAAEKILLYLKGKSL